MHLLFRAPIRVGQQFGWERVVCCISGLYWLLPARARRLRLTSGLCMQVKEEAPFTVISGTKAKAGGYG